MNVTTDITSNTSKEPVNITPMTTEEARECTELIRKNLVMIETTRVRLLDMERRQGFKALKYSSWREWATTEYSRSSQAYLYRLLAAAKVEVNLAADSTIVENIPIAQLTELAKLPPSQQPVALRKADELAAAEDKPRTTSHITKVISQLMPPKEPKLPKHPMQTEAKSEQQNVETSILTAPSWQYPADSSVVVEHSEKKLLEEKTNSEIFDSPEGELINRASYLSLVNQQDQLSDVTPNYSSSLDMNNPLFTAPNSTDTVLVEQIDSLSDQQVATVLETFEHRLGAKTFTHLVVEILPEDDISDLCNKCLDSMNEQAFSRLAVDKINFSGLTQSALSLLNQKSQREIDERQRFA